MLVNVFTLQMLASEIDTQNSTTPFLKLAVEAILLTSSSFFSETNQSIMYVEMSLINVKLEQEIIFPRPSQIIDVDRIM